MSIAAAKERIQLLLAELRSVDDRGGQRVGRPSLYAGLNPYTRKELKQELIMVLKELGDEGE